MKMCFPNKLVILLLLYSLLPVQLSSNFGSRTSSIQEPTPFASGVSSTGEEELAGSMEPCSVNTNPEVAVEEKEQAWSVPENYLYTGDASLLSSSNCRNFFQLTAPTGAIPQDIKALLHQPAVSLTNTVNFLNLIFQASELRETSIREDIEWYHALIRSMFVGERPGLVRNALLSLDADPTAPQPQLMLWASKGSSQNIYLQDLSFAWEKLHLLPHGLNQTWFTVLKTNNQLFSSLSKQVLLNDLSTLDTPKWAHGVTYIPNSSGLQWGEAPFLECKEGRYLPGWLLTLFMPFYGLKPDLNPEFRGVIRVDVSIQDFDVNQCAIGDFWFANTHQCNRTSMEVASLNYFVLDTVTITYPLRHHCEPIPRQGFRLGQYCCRCKEGYYSLPENQLDNGSSSTPGCYPEIPMCVPCWPGCARCQDGSPCWVQEDWHLRAVLLTVHGFFMALVIISMLKAYQCRSARFFLTVFNGVESESGLCAGHLSSFTPTITLHIFMELRGFVHRRIVMLEQCLGRLVPPIRASGLLLLEIILFGSLLLHIPVLIIYFKPSTFRCILLRWVRMLGFAMVYGTVTLKMYRALNVFLSCTAQRVPYMTSTSLLRMLGVMVLTVKWFLCAWTLGVLQNQDRNIPLMITLTTSDGLSFRVCDLDRWDYMMAMAELLFLCWGRSLGSAVRSVPSAFHEPRCMGIAMHNELLFSTVFHLLRFIKPSLHPDWMLLLFFIHIHVTISVTLGLLFFPKFLHLSQLRKEDIASDMYEDEVDLQHSGLHLNNSFTSVCWSDHNLDPDDIRGELRKLYAQLEVHKTKKMENKNPHLRKKRSSCLLLGRSLIRRIAEIPESLSRQGSHKDKDTSGAEGRQDDSGSCLATTESTHVIMRNEIAKLPSPEIQKCVAVEDTSPRNPSMKSCTNKRASVTESIDTSPLFCKSASAQNLAVDNNFLQPVSTRVQKSFSFTDKFRDHYLLASNKSLADTLDVFKPSPKDKTPDKAGVNEEQSKDSNMSNQKQVSEQEILTPKRTLPPALLYVCPWEFTSCLPSSAPPVIKSESGLNSGVESSRPKPQISSSASGSPYSFANPVARCGFSFHSATRTILLAKSLVAKKGNDNHSNKNKLRKEEGKSQQTRSETLSSDIKLVKKTPQTPIRSMTCVESKPSLKKQVAIGQSPVRNSTSNVVGHIYPWKSEDIEYKNIIHGQNVGKQRLSLIPSIESTKLSWHQAALTVPRSTVCRWDVRNRTCPRSSIADICPWDVKKQDQIQPKGFDDDDDDDDDNGLTWEADITQMQKRTRENQSICPWEPLGQKRRINSKGAEKHLGQTEAEVFPSNVKQDSAKLVLEATKPTERVICVTANPDTIKLERQEIPRSDVCPWEASDTHTNQEIMCVDVYPWKLDAILGKYSETIRSSDTKSPITSSRKHLLTKQPTSTAAMDICPWDFPEEFSSQRKSEKLLKTDAEKVRADVKKTITMPDLLKKQLTPIVKEVYPLESDKTLLQPKQKEETGLSSQVSTTKTTDSSSQKAEASVRSESITITKDAATSVLHERLHDKICIWENMRLENEHLLKSQQKQITPLVNVDTLHKGESEKQIQKKQTAYADICQALSQNDFQGHAGPPELEVFRTSSIQAGFHGDVSTWESDSEQRTSMKTGISEKMKEDTIAHTAQGARANRPLTRCNALCPWEIKGGSQASSIKNNNSDTLTWDEPIAEEESDAETAAEAFIFPPDL